MQRKLVPDVIAECQVTTVTPNKTVREAAILMTSLNIGALLVVDFDKLLGIVTERDLMKKVLAGELDPDITQVSAIMTENPDTVKSDSMASDALDMMVNRGYRHLPIVDDDLFPIGIVSVRDLYQAVQATLQEDLASVESYVMGGGDYSVAAS